MTIRLVNGFWHTISVLEVVVWLRKTITSCDNSIRYFTGLADSMGVLRSHKKHVMCLRFKAMDCETFMSDRVGGHYPSLKPIVYMYQNSIIQGWWTKKHDSQIYPRTPPPHSPPHQQPMHVARGNSCQALWLGWGHPTTSQLLCGMMLMMSMKGLHTYHSHTTGLLLSAVLTSNQTTNLSVFMTYLYDMYTNLRSHTNNNQSNFLKPLFS